MQFDDKPGFQNTLWWIASIAVSVVCCSVLFILFASYLVELKADIKDNTMRINAVEARQDRILTDIEAMNKRNGLTAAASPVSSTTSETTDTPAASTGTLTNISVEPPATDSTTVTVPVAPPVSTVVTAPAVTAPDSTTLPTVAPVSGSTSSVPSTISVAPSPASTVPTVPTPAQP